MNPPSPCTRVCQLGDDDICTGCFRSKGEIAGWMQMNEREKSAVNTALKDRSKNFTTGKWHLDTIRILPCPAGVEN